MIFERWIVQELGIRFVLDAWLELELTRVRVEIESTEKKKIIWKFLVELVTLDLDGSGWFLRWFSD